MNLSIKQGRRGMTFSRSVYLLLNRYKKNSSGLRLYTQHPDLPINMDVVDEVYDTFYLRQLTRG